MRFHFDGRVGTGLLGLSMALAVGCSDGATNPDECLPLQLLVIGPDSVAAQVRTEVPLSVRVVNEIGAARAGASVVWSVDAGSGEIDPAHSVADGTGRAGAAWTLGTGAGLQGATAALETRCSFDSVGFAATALPGPAAQVTIDADSLLLVGYGERALVEPTVADVYGNLIPGSPVTWQTAEAGVIVVDEEGLVRAEAPGEALLTAAVPGSADSLRVTVDPRGAITITFDDAWATTHHQAFPVLQEHRLPANVAVITGSVGVGAYMTLPQLEELNAAGWSLVSHSVSHPHLTGLSDAELDTELRESQAWLSGNGFAGAEVFVVPHHDWGPRERLAVGRFYRAARGATATFFWPDSIVPWRPPDAYGLTAVEADSLPYTTPEGRQRLRGYLERSVEESLFLEVFFHQVPPERVPALREAVGILAEFADRVLPYHELFGELRVVR